MRLTVPATFEGASAKALTGAGRVLGEWPPHGPLFGSPLEGQTTSQGENKHLGFNIPAHQYALWTPDNYFFFS